MKFVLLAIVALMISSCGTRIEPGFAGVMVTTTGANRGVQSTVLPTGWTAHGPYTKVYEYPTYTVNYVFTRDKNEGSPDNEEFSIQSSEALMCGADVGISMHFEKDKLPKLFETYRQDVDGIRNVVVRNKIRDAFNKYSSDMTAEEIFSARKNELMDSVRSSVTRDLTPSGIIVESISLINGIRPPKAIQDAISAKVEATQKAMQRENELRTADAQAAKDIAQARGEAEANRLRESSATAKIIELKQLEVQQAWIAKWDGKLPTTVLGDSKTMMVMPK